MTDHEREVRAARNQSMFRAVNEKIRALNETFAMVTREYAIACECADTSCTATLEIGPDAYSAIRANPRQFAVLHGHVVPEVEDVVGETDAYVVVEKVRDGATVAEALAPTP